MRKNGLFIRCFRATLWLIALFGTLQQAALAQGDKTMLTARAGSPPLIEPEDAAVLMDKLALASEHASLCSRALAVARSFENTPYGLLSKTAEEHLVISARLFDCWTFVETTLAIALAAQHEEAGPERVADYVRQLRYWGGTVDGYASRVHYLSGWLRQAQDLGYLRDITKELGGQPFQKDINYMSTHPEQYPPLREPETMRRLLQVEARLSRRTHYYIPQQDIERVEAQLREGDIIAITSARPGLDFAHLGFAVVQHGRVHLLHASSLQKRVVVSAQPLGTYVRSQKGQIGIAVIRLVPEK